MRHRCIGFNLTIDTDVPISGTLPTIESDDAAIRIGWQPAVAPPHDERPVWCRTEAALWFDPPGVGRYRCTADAIEVTPVAGAAPETVDALLVATALPALMWLRGDVVLHASAVIPCGGKGALAISGASGVGKSRLAAAFLARGAKLIADDSIAVRWQGHQAICAGLAGGYHLGKAGDRVRTFHCVPEQQTSRSAAFRALVILSDNGQTRPERLTGIRSIEALLANRHRASVPRLSGAEPRMLSDVVRLAQAVEVYRWPATRADALLDDEIRRAIMRDNISR